MTGVEYMTYISKWPPKRINAYSFASDMRTIMILKSKHRVFFCKNFDASIIHDDKNSIMAWKAIQCQYNVKSKMAATI